MRGLLPSFSFWRRWHSCPKGEHRETVDTAGGSVLQYRCLDCYRTVALGFVVRGTNKLHPHWPWERDA